MKLLMRFTLFEKKFYLLEVRVVKSVYSEN